MEPTIVDKITGDELWRITDCAEHCGILSGTWRQYVARGHAPKPVGHLDARTPLWDAHQIRAWNSNRPGSPVPGR
ncbi:hypothetical protein M0E81_10625 [Corynebacterium sp. CCM 9187]|nr:hypothetical protein [Corynebacterium pygosceleis]